MTFRRILGPIGHSGNFRDFLWKKSGIFQKPEWEHCKLVIYFTAVFHWFSSHALDKEIRECVCLWVHSTILVPLFSAREIMTFGLNHRWLWSRICCYEYTSKSTRRWRVMDDKIDIDLYINNSVTIKKCGDNTCWIYYVYKCDHWPRRPWLLI